MNAKISSPASQPSPSGSTGGSGKQESVKQRKTPAVTPAAEAPKVNRARELKFVVGPNTTEDRVAAEMALGPLVGNMSTALDYSAGLMGDLVLQDCVEVMADDIKGVNNGDLNKLEGMLTAQAHALNAMFNHYAKKALRAQYLPQIDTFCRLAMKAQAQCRTAVEAIAEIKAPKSPTFIKQANIAQQQQVNNGSKGEPRTPAHAREKDITPTNELLTKEPYATLDSGRTSKAIGIDSEMETVGAVHRPAH